MILGKSGRSGTILDSRLLVATAGYLLERDKQEMADFGSVFQLKRSRIKISQVIVEEWYIFGEKSESYLERNGRRDVNKIQQEQRPSNLPCL